MAGEQDIGKGDDQVKFDRTDRTAESTAEDSVIAGDRKQDHQQRHQEMKDSGRTFQGMNKLGEQEGIKPADYESVTIVALTEDGEIKASGKTGFKEKDLEQAAMPTSFRHGSTVNSAETVQEILQAAQNPPSGIGDSSTLLASNVAPIHPITGDGKVQFDTARDADMPDEALAKDFFQSRIPFRVTSPNSDRLLFPLRGFEDQHLAECTNDNPNAWSDAVSAIPLLRGTGLTPEHLMAVVRNELHFYDRMDAVEDSRAKAGEKPSSTLGYSQITPKGIAEFNRDIPEFGAFLKERGYRIPGDEQKVLEDPTCVPMITAAKMASLVKSYQTHNRNHPDRPVVINPESLIYGYNADVQALNNNGNITFESMSDKEAEVKRKLGYDLHKVYPTSDSQVLGTSNHLKNVLRQLDEIRQHN